MLAEEVKLSGLVLQVGHMLHFDPGIQAARKFIDKEMGQMLALKAWYCDSTHRYDMTDALQPMPRQGSRVIKPKGDPKANLQQYYMLTHGCHLVDLARFLGGPITAVRARHLAVSYTHLPLTIDLSSHAGDERRRLRGSDGVISIGINRNRHTALLSEEDALRCRGISRQRTESTIAAQLSQIVVH